MITPNEKLQRARLEKRWSVTAASRRVGVSTNTFNRWERGLQIPQLATLDQLIETFEMSADELGFGFVISPHRRGENAGYSIRNMQSPHIRSTAASEAEAELFSRRQVIAALIGTPAAVFCARQGDSLSLLRVEEILTLCASHVPLCWQLYFEGGQAEVEQVLPDYITQLSTLTRHPSTYQKKAATLLSQAYQLASLLATQHQNYGAASLAARQGLFYGEMAEDLNLQVASCIRQALVYFYLKRSRPRLQAYQSALRLAPSTSPLLQGRVYLGMVEVCSKLGQEDEARGFLEKAQKTFPQQAEADPNYACTHFSLSSVSSFEGIMYLNLGHPDRAWQMFTRADRLVPTGPVPARLELTVRQAATTCALDELEQTCQYLEMAVSLAHILGCQLRVDESYEIYERLLSKWGHEQAVQELGERFLFV